jgi:glycosyltransferase involved in cell wall biosynthesis
MRVVHLIKATGLAGAEAHLLVLLEGLRRAGIEAQLLILVEPGNPAEALGRAAAERGIPAARRVILSDLDVSLWPRLARDFRHVRPAIVHTHLIHADVHGLVAARLASVPIVVTTRHNLNPFRARPFFRLLHRFYWPAVDAAIAVSDGVRRFSVDVEHAAPAGVRTIRLGIDEPEAGADPAALRAELGIAASDRVVGMVGRLVEQKGFVFGLEAFARVADRFPNCRLVVAGDGPLRRVLERHAQGLGVSARVLFLGWRPDAAALMSAFDVLLVPSLWEGFGFVILEGMQRGLPIVASAVGGVPEVVADGTTGLLTQPRDVAGIGRALAELLADDPHRQRLGRLARERAREHFSAQRMVADTIELYNGLVAETARGAAR